MKHSIAVIILIFISNISYADKEFLKTHVENGSYGGKKIYPIRIRKGTGKNSDDYWVEFKFYLINGRPNKLKVNAENKINKLHIIRHRGLDGSFQCVGRNNKLKKCYYRLLSKHGNISININGLQVSTRANAKSVYLTVQR